MLRLLEGDQLVATFEKEPILCQKFVSACIPSGVWIRVNLAELSVYRSPVQTLEVEMVDAARDGCQQGS
jgi:hypothetical protein